MIPKMNAFAILYVNFVTRVDIESFVSNATLETQRFRGSTAAPTENIIFQGQENQKCSKIQPFVDRWIRAPFSSPLLYKFPSAFDSAVSRLAHPELFLSSFSLFTLIQTINLLEKVTFVLPICSVLALFFIHYLFQGIGTWSL